MKLEALPNLPILGPKFKGNKTFGEVKTAITQLTTEQLLNCKKEGKIVLAENELNAEDLIIKEKFIEGNIQEYEAIGG